MKQYLLGIAFFLFTYPVTAAEKVLVYAAASTSNAVSEIIKQYNQVSPDSKVKASFASSSTLAKQIEAGAPAHVFISASPGWMDYLQERNLIVKQSRKNILSNTIVLITPKGKPISVEMNKTYNFSTHLEGKLCIGDPSHVPVGIYAKQALESMGWWKEVKPYIVGTKDVRAALAFVELAECNAGIVYSTDANKSKKVELAAEFPADSHNPIVYPVAKLASANESTDSFITYLSSPQALAIFKKYGFNTQ
ncbi:MAG: molybdate ABC transporter substrate-binding protein [Methylococcaceae bacterium]|nr:molybdate ABC transporter substrate-binding protein [Methylococcaceae bacterium]